MTSERQDLSFRSLLALSERKGRRYIESGHQLRSGDGRYTNLALILSDQCPWRTEIRSRRGRESVLSGSIFEQMAEAEGIVLGMRTLQPAPDEPALRLPDLAFYEAMLNAVCHRSYCSGEPIVIDIDARSVSVTSPGG